MNKTKPQSIKRIIPLTTNDQPLIISTRNTAIGMALTYLDHVDQVLNPVYFLFQNLLTIFISLLHLFVPLTATWFLSHWNAPIENAFWGGPVWDKILGFISAWVVLMFFWSLIWILFKMIITTIMKAIQSQPAKYKPIISLNSSTILQSRK